MRIRLLISIGLLALGGCANISAPLRTQSDPNVKLATTDSFAFWQEPDIRIEKRLFYERAAKYLADAGYHMVEPQNADYLVTVYITTELLARFTVPLDSVTPHISAKDKNERREQGDTTFRFAVYRGADLKNMRMAAVWEALLSTSDIDFRQNEEQYVNGIFGFIGKTYDGKLTFKRKANQQPERNDPSRHAGCNAPVAPAWVVAHP